MAENPKLGPMEIQVAQLLLQVQALEEELSLERAKSHSLQVSFTSLKENFEREDREKDDEICSLQKQLDMRETKVAELVTVAYETKQIHEDALRQGEKDQADLQTQAEALAMESERLRLENGETKKQLAGLKEFAHDKEAMEYKIQELEQVINTVAIRSFNWRL